MEEWEAATDGIKRLDGVVEYSLVRGNHDSEEMFSKYIGYDAYMDRLDGTFKNNPLNSYQAFYVGSIKYLVLCLDYNPSNAVLDWANKVIKSTPSTML